jgi:ribonuclease HII
MRAYFTENYTEVGVDEVGRGCLAGSVVAAAVILPKNFYHPTLTDSKQMSEKVRLEVETYIKENALAWAIAEASVEEIDMYNIASASVLAMHRALDKIFTQISPELILVDGKYFKPYGFVPYECIVKGDAKFFSIAAASVLAKNYRDAQMRELAQKFPYYAWEKNVGYPTAEHKKGIEKHGISPFHRKTFGICKQWANAKNLLI